MTVTRGGQAAGDEISLDRVRVLVVDDDERWARVTGRLLEATNDAFTVETAHTLGAGRDRFEGSEFDCVVCDYQLGDGTGLDLLEVVRERDGSLPFLLVTGQGDEAVASDAIGGGVTDYIRKDADDDNSDLLARRVASAVRTYRTERALERERRSKNAMLEVLTATTARAELYQQFCTQLVEARGYACAWIGTTDGSDRPVPRAAAGCEGYLEDVTGDDERPLATEPAGRALDRDEPVVVRDIGDEAGDPDGDAAAGETNGDAEVDEVKTGSARADWAATASEYGFESAVAVPVRHEGVRFGVLAAYAATPGVVDQRERAALVEYAGTVGYALQTAERKRSLMSASPVTVEARVADERVPVVAFARWLPEATVEILSAVIRDDGSTFYVAEVRGASPGDLRVAAEDVDAIRSFDAEGDEGATERRCEIVASPPTPEELLADSGARFERTVVENGVATVSVQVPDDEAVTTIAEALDAEYADATVSTIWTDREEGAVDDDPLAELTDRQREVLRHAVEVGYFERPRGASATDLADHFDVARTTVSQHLRTAQRKVLGRVLF